jgi:glutamate decarboxylase
MLAVLAMKKCWKNKRVAKGLPCDKPNIIMSSGESFELGGHSASLGPTSIFGNLSLTRSVTAVQVCWEKAARYFEVEEKLVYCAPDRYVIDPQQAADLVDENTIGICLIMGTTYTGMRKRPTYDVSS